MLRLLYKLCTNFLFYFGRLFSLSYDKMSVVFNLYLQGTLLMLSGGLPLLASGYAMVTQPNMFNIGMGILLLIYASFYIAGWVLMIKHYPPRWEYSFNLCVDDLLRICHRFHMTYVILNLLIFIVWWLALIGVNLLLSYFILQTAL